MANTDNDGGMALMPYSAAGIVMPLVDVAGARAAIKAYEELKQAIATKDDFVSKAGKTFLKKAYWRRVATLFGISLELAREERTIDENGILRYSVIYRAIAPNGRSMEGDGACTSRDVTDATEHNIRAKAHTRAKNRAISDLVGGGEVSADEIDNDDEPRHTPQSPRRPAPPQRPQPIRPAVKAAQVPAVEVEPPMTFVEAAAEDADAVADDRMATTPLTIAGFLAKAKAELDLNPKQAMERLGVRALSGLNLDEAFAKLSDGLRHPPAMQREYDLRDLPMAAHGSH